MFQTRGDLKRRIAALEQERDALYNIQKITETSGLSKCKGIVCKSCEHAVFISDGIFGAKMIGCDVTVNCQDYKRLSNG